MKIYSDCVIFQFLLSVTLFAQNTQPPTEGGCQIFPADNVWNTRVDQLPVDPSSAAYISSSGGQSTPFHPDFGTVYNGAPNGLPYVVVPANQPTVPIVFTAYGVQSDPGPYPVPANAPVEGGLTSTGDRHVIVIQSGTCKLFEMFFAYPQSDGSWQADSGALFDLTVDGPLRPASWTSADAAGLPIFPGLVRYNDVQQALAADGMLHHALRFTVATTRNAYIWPARHQASSNSGLAYPPMGQRFRLKASTNIDVYPGTTTAVSATNRVILQTLKIYGMIVADNGGDFHVTGAPDPSWDDGDLHNLTYYKAGDFEAIDESSLMIDPNSGQALQSGAPTISLTAPASGTTISGTVTVSAQAQAAAGIRSVEFLLDGGTSLGTFIGGGPNFSVAWSTSGVSNGTHSLTAVVVDAQGASATASAANVTVANSAPSGTAPTTFTTYLSPYGGGSPTISGGSVTLPLRGSIPGGATQFSFLIANLIATAGGASEYQIIAETDGAGGYTLRVSNGITTAPPWPNLQLTQNGSMTSLPTPISIGTLQITGYHFALVGNEFQLDLAVTRTGTFDDQIVILGVAGSTYSSPWSVSDGEWTSSGTPATSPSSFTTYLSPYGSGSQTIVGNSALLALRGYTPGGAGQFSFLIANLNATADGTSEYQIIAETDGAGDYTLRISNSVASSPWPNVTMAQGGSMMTLTTPISLSTLQIAAYRFALVGNEFQLDLAVTRSGAFSDQIVILGVAGSAYSAPWAVSDGVWSSN